MGIVKTIVCRYYFKFYRNNINKLIEKEKQKNLSLDYSNFVNNSKSLSRRISELDVNRNNEIDIENVNKEIIQLEDKLNNYVQHCNAIFPIMIEIKNELYLLLIYNIINITL